MAEVKFLVGTSEQYNGVASKDTNTLYFLTDTLKIMKGESDYTSSVLLVNSFPDSGQIQGKLYINITTGVGQIWTGAAWQTVLDKIGLVNDLTTGGTDKALTAEQGKTLKGLIDTHEAKTAGSDFGHVKTGGDVEVADGIITVKKIDGTEWNTIKQGIDDNIAEKASLAGATFTGDVKLTGSPEGDTSAVSKKFVEDLVSTSLGDYDALRYKGTIGTSGTVEELPTTYAVGDTYKVITAGEYAGANCEVGDMLIAIVAREGSENANSDWTIAQTNIDGAVIGPASATDSTVVLFDGATGKQIKGSEITLAQLQSAITNAHTHANKSNLDTYTKDMTQLQSDIEAAANEYTDTEIGTAKSELQGAIDTLKISDLADVDTSGILDGQVLYWDNASSTWKVKTIASVDISGKMDKMSTSTANNVVLADGAGGVKDSGKKLGGAALAGSPDANTLATELAVKTYGDSIQTVWESIS